MGGLDDAEVASVERGDLRLSETLTQGDDGGIDETEIELGIPPFDLDGAEEILGGDRLEPVSAPGNIVDERPPHLVTEELQRPVVDLGEHGAGDDQILREPLDELDASPVIAIIGVQQCQDRTRVQDEGHSISPGTHAGRRMLVQPGRRCGTHSAPANAEACTLAAAKVIRLAADDLAKHLGERDAAAPCFLLENG